MDQMPLRERNRRRTAQRIIDTASALFRTRGYEQTTMEMIADQAEVSRGTLFNYFATKEALLVPLAIRLYQEHVQPAVEAYLITQPPTLDALRFFFMSIHDHILTLPYLQRALEAELFHHDASKGDDADIGFFSQLALILAQGQQRGDVGRAIPLEKVTRYVGVLYLAIVIDKVESPQAALYAAAIDTLLIFLRQALAAS